jgi:hypothetical protein
VSFWPGCGAVRAPGSRTRSRHSSEHGLPTITTGARCTDHTILGLELDDVGLVAVGSHEEEFVRDGVELVTSTYLECAAVSTELQGAVLPGAPPLDEDGRPVTLGRYLLEVLLSDVPERERAPIVRAVVARENARSLRLCTRIGLIEEREDPDARFVQRIGRMTT